MSMNMRPALRRFCSSANRFSRFFCHSIYSLYCFYTSLLFKISFFWIQLLYFPLVALLGFLALKMTGGVHPPYTNLDLFFTSVAACTAGGLPVIEMEELTNKQLVVITATMFFGEEVVVSMLELVFKLSKLLHSKAKAEKVIQLCVYSHDSDELVSDPEKIVVPVSASFPDIDEVIPALKTLILLIASYLLSIHLIGSVLVGLYLARDRGSKALLEKKHLRHLTFAAFSVTSIFSNCGFLPNNENAVAFRKAPGLLLLWTPLIFLGNTLYGPALRFIVWCLEKVTGRNVFRYILSNRQKTGFSHLFTGRRSRLLLATAVVFVSAQIALFCALEWHAVPLAGLTGIEKLVASLFQSANSRHAGANVVDLSTLSPATLVFFILMMYLPPYTSFDPTVQTEESRSKNSLTPVEWLSGTNLTYITAFVTIVCITEAENILKDPLNFSILFIVFEIVSAYGDVGFSAGYSCQRQLVPDGICRSVSYALVGKWTPRGKTVLIIVMLFGRFKRFNLRAGKAWRFD